MKRILILLMLLGLFSGCGTDDAQIAATTGPVWQFASMLCDGTPLSVSRVVTENVSCLHDYTLTVGQMKLLESAQIVVISGAGLEEFMHDVLHDRTVIDASKNVPLLESSGDTHEEHAHEHEHEHEHDPHIWLSPANAAIMARNICTGLSAQYPEYAVRFEQNLHALTAQIEALDAYGKKNLSELTSREMITFHDGFAYLAEHYDLTILRAIEEESGSEASAKELIELIGMVRQHDLPAVFTEVNGSASSAEVITREAGVPAFPLDMAMAGTDWFSAMYHNIDTLKEALE